MGNRISIQFEKDGEQSVCLFSHWGGMSFKAKADIYVADLKMERGDKESAPLDRLEPNTVMVDFIRYLTKDVKRVESNYYLGATDSDGDNSDNGHFVIKL